jgi:hypothetical protein
MPETCTIALDNLVADPKAWPRQRLDSDRIALFVDLYGDDGPDALPPIEVVVVGAEEYLLTDGWHRVAALDEIGAATAEVAVVAPAVGEDPWTFAYRRGLETCVDAARPLNQTERRTATEKILQEHPDWPDVQIARLTGVSNATVGRARRRVFNANPATPAGQAPSDDYVRAKDHRDVSRTIVRGLAKLWDSRPLLMTTGLQDSARLGDTIGEELIDKHGTADAIVWAERMQRWADRAFLLASDAHDAAQA